MHNFVYLAQRRSQEFSCEPNFAGATPPRPPGCATEWLAWRHRSPGPGQLVQRRMNAASVGYDASDRHRNGPKRAMAGGRALFTDVAVGTWSYCTYGSSTRLSRLNVTTHYTTLLDRPLSAGSHKKLLADFVVILDVDRDFIRGRCREIVIAATEIVLTAERLPRR